MKVVMVDAALRENGGVRVMLDLANRWNATGTPTTVFSMQRVADEARQPARPEARAPIVYGQPRIGRLRWGVPLIVARFIRVARDADVIVCLSEVGLHILLGGLVAALLRRPLVVAVHTPIRDSIADWVPRGLRRLTLFVNRRAAASICVSRGIADAAIAAGIPARQVTVVTNGVDGAAIQARAALPPPADLPAPLVVGVGRLSSQKGFDLLIRAHAAVVRAGEPHHLMIVGEGADRDQLTRLVAELGVGDSVHLVGFRDNPHAIMARADLFCLSSRYEGHPLILIEALAVGAPIVAADCVSGPAEILADGKYGDLVEVGSVDALAGAIRRHLADPAHLAATAALGPARAAEFDPDACAARYVEVFRSATGGGRAGAVASSGTRSGRR